jgi:hypothetical protein
MTRLHFHPPLVHPDRRWSCDTQPREHFAIIMFIVLLLLVLVVLATVWFCVHRLAPPALDRDDTAQQARAVAAFVVSSGPESVCEAE